MRLRPWEQIQGKQHLRLGRVHCQISLGGHPPELERQSGPEGGPWTPRDLRPGSTLLQITSGIVWEQGPEGSQREGAKLGGSEGKRRKGRALMPPPPQCGSHGGHPWPYAQSWGSQDLCREGNILSHLCEQASRAVSLC